MSAALLQIAGWSFFRSPTPPSRSPTYVQHYRYTYAAVVLCYLTYNFIDASRGLPKNFYELLGVEPRPDEGALKAAFRAFARKNHPDRVGSAGEAHFIAVRDAFEALKDPVVRFAYDRFGPDVLRWKECSTMKEYLRRGLVNSSMYHLMTWCWTSLVLSGWKAEPHRCSESSAYTFIDQAPPHTTLFDTLFPRRVVYQHVLFLHQIFFFMSVGLSRVAPVLFAGLMRVDGEVEEGAVRAMGERIGELAKGVDRELSIMLNTELHSIHQPLASTSTSAPAATSLTPADMLKAPEHLDEFTMEAVMREMEDIIVENKLKSEVGPMRSAWDRSIGKSLGGERREEGKFSGAWRGADTTISVAARGRLHGRARSMSL
ncbi:DnaJ-domain-containing protein [Melanogaster broomeanus]|nr:DnaJ-domain-containing protein [Melanogaster broomeanus]